MKKAKLHFVSQLPSHRQFGDEAVLIYDRMLENISPALRKWIRGFDARYAVKSGESLKALDAFPLHIKKFMKIGENLSARRMTIVVLGGGSVGDFGGFVASVYKRGVRLVHIPSTWLAAIDSSHGGKTALNVGGVKNQIGTFYPAGDIFLVKSLLQSQPAIRAEEAFAEIYKVALLQGGAFWKSFSRGGEPSSVSLWKFLKPAIAAKYKIVAADPLEISGHRHFLNLGHSLGHALESYYLFPHGIAVNYGMEFALRWSEVLGDLSAKESAKLWQAPASRYLRSAARDALLDTKAVNGLRHLLGADKKKTDSRKLRFIFTRGPGRCFIREVSFDEVMREVRRQAVEARG